MPAAEELGGFDLGEELDGLWAAASRFAGHELAPAVRESERSGHWPPGVVDVVVGFGLRDLDVPERLGGAGPGGGCLAKVVLLEALAMGDPGGLPAADQPGMAAGALVACPDDGVAADVAAACLAGEAQAALVVGEQARVEWAPAWPALRWAWVSDGDRLRLLEIGEPGQAVPVLGFHASGAISVDLAGAPVTGQWDLPAGAGAAVRGRARLWSGAVAVGIAQAAFDATIAYTTERVVFGKAVAHHQGNAFELAALATRTHGARLAVRDAARSFDQGDPHAGFWATEAWLTAVDTAVAVTDAGIQLLGGHGFLVDHVAEKRFREARMLGLLAGGRDAALDDVASQVLDVPDPVYAATNGPA